MWLKNFFFRFLSRFEQYNHTAAKTTLENIDSKVMEKIKERNNLDIKLYEYAKELLQKRYKLLSSHDPHFHEHFQSMGKIEFNWEDIENAL